MTEIDQQPTTGRPERQEAAIDTLVGFVLLAGVAVSVILVAAGLLWRWARTGQLGVEYTIARMNLFEFVVSDVRQVASGAFRPRLLISLGIAALMLTPYVRVLASLLFFAFVERNWKYSAFTAFVLAVLTYSLFLR